MSGPTPRIEIDLGKIKHNAGVLVDLCRKAGVGEVIGVTKGAVARPDVAGAMLAGGVAGLADSRLENLARMRRAGLRSQFTLLRLPSPSRIDEVVRLADRSLNSEPEILKLLSRAATAAGRTHGVILMVELGDRREGLLPDDVPPAARLAASLSGVTLDGLGVNLTCYGAVIPTPANLGRLVELAETVRREVGAAVPVVSGGNSSSMPLVLNRTMPAGVTQLRLGEAILRGVEAAYGRPIPGTAQDAFTVVAEVIEVKEKASLPEGEIGRDAFWNIPHFEDRGVRRRALLALGRQDCGPENLVPEDEGMIILGASSDHLIVDVGDAARPVRLGDELRFATKYAAMLQAMTSPYVAQVPIRGAAVSAAPAVQPSEQP